ncbi:unnamed protein product [Penicillium salamii]|uniref:Zn(2)-C6 fungal-type domain-containing protein n=1 Tax=Penicillium salamii TaxID=1612424 RepID=A0A9W4JXW1_9EURO|nr:unnamed protein product [Penicillium salamii]
MARLGHPIRGDHETHYCNRSRAVPHCGDPNIRRRQFVELTTIPAVRMSLSDSRAARQRATAACDFCRQRKRRCNGQRPTCSNCQAANVECVYLDLEQRRLDVKTSFSVIEERLDRLEATMTEHSSALSDLQPWPAIMSTPASHLLDHAIPSSINPPTGSSHESGASHAVPSGTLNTTIDTESDAALPPMTIPLWHSTTTQALLSCEKVKSLVGEYPSDVFLQIEERRQLPTDLRLSCITGDLPSLPYLDRRVTDVLIEYYFQSVNMQHPILDYDVSLAQYHRMASENSQPPLESALILIILALSEAARTNPPERLEEEWSPGSAYFLPALSVALDGHMNSPTTAIALPQCLYLAALYYNFLARPLDSWRFVHMASTSFQRLWIRYLHPSNMRCIKTVLMTLGITRSNACLEMNDLKHQPLIRLCWAIFSLECDLIAEHHVPRSGVETLVDRIQLPLCGEQPSPSLLAWLAELSARRLLNRVHHVMYEEDQEHLLHTNYSERKPSGNEEDAVSRLMDSYLRVSMELDEQLNNWYNLIPHVIKPDMDQVPTEVQKAAMVLRYHSAKDIIFRPFLLFACSLPVTFQLPQSLLEICRTVIYSCRQYIFAAGMRLREPSASTEIIIHSLFASTIILTIAALNPWLKEYVLDINDLQEQATCTIQRWAFDGSCIQAMALMLNAIQNKTKMLQAGF